MDISKNIEYWSSLIGLNESSSVLLDNLAKVFGSDVVFNIKKISITDELMEKLFDALNDYLFHGKLEMIPVKCISFQEASKVLTDRGSSPPSEDFLGVHSVVLFNEDKVSRESKLDLRNDIILLNRSNVDNRSFVFVAATLCHEMIHLYDRFFGEYEKLVRFEVLSGIPTDPHADSTFKHFMNLANEENLNVIPYMHTTDIEMIDYETMEKMISSIYESDEVSSKYNSKFNNDKVRYYFDHIHMPKMKNGLRSINHYD